MRFLHAISVASITLSHRQPASARVADSSGKAALCATSSSAPHTFLSRYRGHLPERLRLQRGAFVIVCDGQTAFTEGFGVSAAGDSVDPNRTIFRAASNAKLIVATAVMQLADRGLWSLGDSVNRYLPAATRLRSFDRAGPVTLEHLLTHTAGFENRFAGSVVVPADRLTLAEFFGRNRPRRVAPPGLAISYSNIGMALAGYAVEVASGEPFARYAERHIFAPLGMTHSSYDQPPPAAWTRDLAGGAARGRYDVVFNPYPAASLVTTPADMGRFIAAHLGSDHRALGMSDAAIAAMQSSHWRAQPDAPGVAYGFFEGVMNGRRTLFHTGDSGDHSLVLLLPDEKVGLYFVFSGSDEQTDARDDFARQFMDAFFPADSVAARTPSRPPSIPVTALAGTYRSVSYSRSNFEKVRALLAQVTIRAGSHDTLLVTPPGSATRLAVARIGPLTFRRDSGEVLAFRTDPRGAVVGFTLGGLIWDPSSWDRVAWWEDGRLHLAALGVAALALIARVGWTPASWIVRRARGLPAPTQSVTGRRLWRWSGLAAAIIVGAPFVAAATALLSFMHPLRAIPRAIAVGSILLLVGSVAGSAMLATVFGQSQATSLTRARRIAITCTGAACVVIFVLGFYWNLIAPWALG